VVQRCAQCGTETSALMSGGLCSSCHFASEYNDTDNRLEQAREQMREFLRENFEEEIYNAQHFGEGELFGSDEKTPAENSSMARRCAQCGAETSTLMAGGLCASCYFASEASRTSGADRPSEARRPEPGEPTDPINPFADAGRDSRDAGSSGREGSSMARRCAQCGAETSTLMAGGLCASCYFASEASRTSGFPPDPLKKAIELYGDLESRVEPYKTLVELTKEFNKIAREAVPNASELERVSIQLDAHHIIEERYYYRFQDEFREYLGWNSPADMAAIAIHHERHNRNGLNMAEKGWFGAENAIRLSTELTQYLSDREKIARFERLGDLMDACKDFYIKYDLNLWMRIEDHLEALRKKVPS
jgi:hypothetical protein